MEQPERARVHCARCRRDYEVPRWVLGLAARVRCSGCAGVIDMARGAARAAGRADDPVGRVALGLRHLWVLAFVVGAGLTSFVAAPRLLGRRPEPAPPAPLDLRARLAGAAEPAVRLRIIRAVAWTDAESDVAALVETIASDPDDAVREAAVERIAEAPIDAGPRAVSVLLDALERDDGAMLPLLETTLAVQPRARVIRQARDRLDRSPDAIARVRLVGLLFTLKAGRAAERALHARILHDPDVRVRAAAAYPLGAAPATFERLVRRLESSLLSGEPAEEKAALRALGMVSHLLRRTDFPCERLRHWWVADILPLVLASLVSRDRDTRRGAEVVLLLREEPPADAEQARACWTVRTRAVVALGELPPTPAIDATLETLLSDPPAFGGPPRCARSVVPCRRRHPTAHWDVPRAAAEALAPRVPEAERTD